LLLASNSLRNVNSKQRRASSSNRLRSAKHKLRRRVSSKRSVQLPKPNRNNKLLLLKRKSHKKRRNQTEPHSPSRLCGA